MKSKHRSTKVNAYDGVHARGDLQSPHEKNKSCQITMILVLLYYCSIIIYTINIRVSNHTPCTNEISPTTLLHYWWITYFLTTTSFTHVNLMMVVNNSIAKVYIYETNLIQKLALKTPNWSCRIQLKWINNIKYINKPIHDKSTQTKRLNIRGCLTSPI